ncbi:arylamine N-acetyltransferase [Elysia marginata]|uniref:arylamine N-acetyltransferase n=1 Tax=Elysia marginata TaxID=1093978 RepID=A0AAV4I1S7_9GAST|nr:arylamine N-acetyltransferase [Elysia marginata]
MAADMFTPEEAFSFVAEKLKVKNVRERIASDRKRLLDDIAVAMQTELPFQNVHLLRISRENRRRPTLEEIKADILTGAGGLCYNVNVTTFYLLKALGFEVVLVHGTCTTTVAFLNNHIIVHVKNVEKPGDTVLMETAVGFPTFRAISLDFEKESPAYRDSFIEYKYMKHEGKILRMQRHGDSVPRSNLPEGVLLVIDGWRRLYFTETSGTANIEDFYSNFDEVFTNPKASPFHLSLRVVGFCEKRAAMVINGKTLIENDEGDLDAKEIPGGDEGIVAEVKRLFPVLSEESIRQAVANWRKDTQS